MMCGVIMCGADDGPVRDEAPRRGRRLDDQIIAELAHLRAEIFRWLVRGLLRVLRRQFRSRDRRTLDE
jgi:hypothetical protein